MELLFWVLLVLFLVFLFCAGFRLGETIAEYEDEKDRLTRAYYAAKHEAELQKEKEQCQ